MSVEKVFWQDSYLCRLSSTITSVSQDWITLDRTIGYAFSGGQCSDVISIDGFLVQEALKDDFQLLYRMPCDHHLKVGDVVTMQIDWPFRYRVMKLHFAAELVLQLVLELDGGIEKIGANITDSKARVDFMCEYPLTSSIEQLQSQIDKIIIDDMKIETGYINKDLQRRYWSLENLYTVPCGGIHVNTTGEIGKIKLKRVNLGKDKERIEVILIE